MKTIGSIAEIRQSHQNVPKQCGDRLAVIVQTLLSPRKSILGVQFWTQTMIDAETTTNSDGTTSILICPLDDSI